MADFPNDNYSEFNFFGMLERVLNDNFTRLMTVEEIEMRDCAFLWDLGIRADEDIVRPRKLTSLPIQSTN